MMRLTNVYGGYGGADVIKDISMDAERGEFLCVLGPNGCGKSTLLKSIAGLLNYRGGVRLDAQELSSLSRRELAKKIAFLTQASQVYFPYSVYDTAALGRYAHSAGFLKSLSQEDKAIVTGALKTLGLYEIQDRLISELSGGQLQRVFLARTLVQNPEVILLDEPTNHLDLKHQVELLRYLKDWAGERGKIVIGVLHDLNLARYFSDRAVLMAEGRIAVQGKPEAVLNGEALRQVYAIDVRRFMLESLEKWR